MSAPRRRSRRNLSWQAHHFGEAQCQYPVACSAAINKQQFWQLIEAARSQASNPNDGEEVVHRATSLLATYPAWEIIAAQQALWDVMADSYTNPLWAAAYVINGGCSDDGFDYFRGWLIAQGHEVFERIVADPDTLAEVPVVRASATDGSDLHCEDVLNRFWHRSWGAVAERDHGVRLCGATSSETVYMPYAIGRI